MFLPPTETAPNIWRQYSQLQSVQWWKDRGAGREQSRGCLDRVVRMGFLEEATFQHLQAKWR